MVLGCRCTASRRSPAAAPARAGGSRSPQASDNTRPTRMRRRIRRPRSRACPARRSPCAPAVLRRTSATPGSASAASRAMASSAPAGDCNARAQLAVDLHHDLDRVLHQRVRIRLPASARRRRASRARARATSRARRAESSATGTARRFPAPRAPPRGPPATCLSNLPSAFSSSMTAAIAVLKLRRRPMSSATLASVWCTMRRSSLLRPRRASSIVERIGRRRRLRHGRAPPSTGGAGNGTRPPRPLPTIPASAPAAR